MVPGLCPGHSVEHVLLHEATRTVLSATHPLERKVSGGMVNIGLESSNVVPSGSRLGGESAGQLTWDKEHLYAPKIIACAAATIRKAACMHPDTVVHGNLREVLPNLR